LDKEKPKTENTGGLISVVVKAYDSSNNKAAKSDLLTWSAVQAADCQKPYILYISNSFQELKNMYVG